MGKRLFINRYVAVTLLVFCINITTALANTESLPTQSAKPILAIEHWQTTQHIPVYFVRSAQIPMITINMVFTAGSAYDQQEWGIAELSANLLNQGTQYHDADQIANGFAQVGSQYAVNVDRDMAVISLQSLTQEKYFNPALTLFKEVLTQAKFSQSAFARVQQQLLASIAQTWQDPESVALLTFMQALYQQHPYAHPTDGTAATVKKLKLQDVSAFYQRYYVAQNAKIVMVGDLTLGQARTVAEKIADKLPTGTPATSLETAQPLPMATEQTINFPANQMTMILGQLGINYQDPDFFPLFVGNYVLGNLPLDSLLFREVRRKRGLAYNVTSNFLAQQYVGPFYIELQTRAQKSQQALKVAQQVLTTFLHDGPSPAELQLAKSLIINSFPIALSTNQYISDVLIRMAFYHRPLNYLDTYQAKVQAVTRLQIMQAFAKHIQPDKMLTIKVGQIPPTLPLKKGVGGDLKIK